MKLKSLLTAAIVGTAGLASLITAPAALAQAKEQYFPALIYRTGAYAPNGVPWANGFVDYLKLVNARGGLNGVKLAFEECETGYDAARSVECYERLKTKGSALLALTRGAVPRLTLGGGQRLGWTTWLGRRPDGRPADNLRVDAEAWVTRMERAA